jgi:hypothetical protein
MSTLKSINVIHPSGSTTNIVNDSSGNVAIGNNLTVAGTSTISGNETVTGTVAMGSSFKRNRAINGNMLIDQRNAGASVTIGSSAGTYTLDRWCAQSVNASKFSVQQNAGSVTPPTGFTKYLGVTSLAPTSSGSTDYYGFFQAIEGFNTADLAWGTANAASVTISFWVRSSLTGSFSASLTNSGSNRSYPFSYTVNAANTWEQKTVTVAGDTSGTWLTDNSAGIYLRFDLGCGSSFRGTAGTWAAGNYYGVTGAVSVVGTSGATFYITGVQLEVGTKATPYEMQIYSDQLTQCQRYYYFCNALSYFNGNSGNATVARGGVSFPVPMRVAPTTITVNSGASFSGTTGYAYVSNTNSTTQINVVQTSTVNGFDTIGYSGNLPSASYVYAISYKAEAEL